mmetsp:Transcript_2344/g.5037  ORF Transcript_2344/g.5037 Transcript_2344/m.5037 type:complete len:211 (-) Transcript_2344:154-786(-)
MCLFLFLSVGNRSTESKNLGFFLGNSHGCEGFEGFKFICDFDDFHFSLRVIKGLDRSLELAHSTGICSLLKNDEANQVVLKTLCVQFQRFLGLVDSAVINANSDRSCITCVKSGGLDLFKGESLAQLLLGRVLLGLALDNRSEFLDRGGESSGSLLGSCQSAGLFARCLVQGQTDLKGTTRRLGPLLAAMDIGEDVVVLRHGGKVLQFNS